MPLCSRCPCRLVPAQQIIACTARQAVIPRAAVNNIIAVAAAEGVVVVGLAGKSGRCYDVVAIIANDCYWVIANKVMQVLIFSSFCSSLRSWGTHLADLFARLWSLERKF